MKQITCILDACTIINLIHIDRDEELCKNLNNINYYLCEKVFDEVRLNVFKSIERKKKKNELKENFEEIKSEIEQKLNYFRNNLYYNSRIESEYSKTFFNDVATWSNYTKKNGEFYSSALALFLSRLIDQDSFEGIKLSFHTDDFPAKKEFEDFFQYHQIGHIEDTVDLLILLYRLNEKITKNKLEHLLSELFAQYATDVSEMKNLLNKEISNIPKALIRDKEYKIKLSSLIFKLNNLKFEGCRELRDWFYNKRKKYPKINIITTEYNSVFDLETDSTNLLEKIKLTKAKINVVPIFKI